jgi:hypothetical protein
MGKQEQLTREEIEAEKVEFRAFVKAYQRRTGENIHAACKAWKAYLIAKEEGERLFQEGAGHLPKT